MSCLEIRRICVIFARNVRGNPKAILKEFDRKNQITVIDSSIRMLQEL